VRIICPTCNGSKRIKKPEDIDPLDFMFAHDPKSVWMKCPCCDGDGVQDIDDHPPAPYVPIEPLLLNHGMTAFEKELAANSPGVFR
jgi:hypothetical protein